MLRFIGALIITYFVSRLLRRLGLKHPPAAKLIAAHVLSLVLISLGVIALRQPIDAFDPGQLWVYVLAQVLWLLADATRARVALWKPPVVEPEPRGSSSRRREASSR